ncbi:shikimate kinase [uncultured Arthrobacter sp.]|uniref:shikimate kinase n=1 Tax=uncultured Arthrobacter sp. TaxID=114050 RepID=UPI0028D8E1A6|nr:shikimate kinase [uncultured Arthrobacter sp.]
MPRSNTPCAAGDRPIVLIGPMAVGKSAIGQQLAQQLDAPFVDTDAVIVEGHGSIADIFASRGERAFREIEARTVARIIEAAAGTATVVSLGGGSVLDSGTQQLLERCTVVYLECDADTVAARIAKNSGRPLLAGDGIRRWKALFATRKPVYERLADIVLDVRQGTVPQLGLKLETALCDFAAGKPHETTTREINKTATTAADGCAAAKQEVEK